MDEYYTNFWWMQGIHNAKFGDWPVFDWEELQAYHAAAAAFSDFDGITKMDWRKTHWTMIECAKRQGFFAPTWNQLIKFGKVVELSYTMMESLDHDSAAYEML